MARDSDSYGDGTRPFDASFGDATSGGPVERDATGFLGDDSVRMDLFSGPSVDSTAYAMPAGDPFDDALAERFPASSDSAQPQTTAGQRDTDPTREGQQPAPPVQQAPAPAQPPPPRQRPPAPPRPRGQANRGAPLSQPNRRPAPRQPPPRRTPPNQPPPTRSALSQQAARRVATQPPARPAAKPANPLTLDDLTKRPPIGRQQPPGRPKAGPRRTSSMARFPTGAPQRSAAPPEHAAPARRARNVRPIVPIVIFVVILVGLIRGCANAHDKGAGPPRDVVYSLTR